MTTANDGPVEAFRAAVDRHGHAFQNAVLRRADYLFGIRHSMWAFSAAEVPCEVRGASTRIDFVLQRNDWNGSGPVAYLIAECKRINPALSDWCFARTPYIRRNLSSSRLISDQVLRDSNETLGVDVHAFGHGREVYNLAY